MAYVTTYTRRYLTQNNMFVARFSRAVVYVSGIKVYKIIKGEIRKGKGRAGFFLLVFFFVCFFGLQQVLEPRYQTTLHVTQTRQDSGNVT